MQTVRITTSQNIDIDYEIAGIGDRIVARLIDLGLFLLLMIIVGLLGGFSNSTGVKSVSFIVTWIIYLVLFVFYDLLCEIFLNGQSLGKMVMKIKVISLDGGRPTFGQYLMRWMFRIVDFVITGWPFGVCALIAAATTKKCQRLGDIVAGTTLIKTSPRANITNIAFAPTYEGYMPVFTQVMQLKDKDIVLIHEVMESYIKSGNAVIVYNAAQHIQKLLAINKPAGMDDWLFLQTLVRDYNHLTAIAATDVL